MKKALLQSLARMKEGNPVALLILGEDLTVVSEFTTSTISLAKIAEGGFHLRAEGFGAPLTVRSTGNPLADAMMRKAVTKAFRLKDNERMAAPHRFASHRRAIGTLMRGRKSLLWISAGLSVSGGYQWCLKIRSTD